MSCRVHVLNLRLPPLGVTGWRGVVLNPVCHPRYTLCPPVQFSSFSSSIQREPGSPPSSQCVLLMPSGFFRLFLLLCSSPKGGVRFVVYKRVFPFPYGRANHHRPTETPSTLTPPALLLRVFGAPCSPGSFSEGRLRFDFIFPVTASHTSALDFF